MSRTFLYVGSRAFTYFLVDAWGDAYEVSEDDFFGVVGFDRSSVPMHYDKDNINRQNFFLNQELLGYRVR